MPPVIEVCDVFCSAEEKTVFFQSCAAPGISGILLAIPKTTKAVPLVPQLV